MGNVAVLVTAHNDELTIGYVLDSVPTEILGKPVLLVVSDDASIDNTAKIARSFTAHVLQMVPGRGVGVAMKRGLAYITSDLEGLRGMGQIDFVVKVAGNGQYDLSLLPQVLDPLVNHGAELVIYSHLDRWPDEVVKLSKMIESITDWKIKNVLSGCMGMPCSWAKHLAKHLIVPGPGVSMEIILRYWAATPETKVVEIPYPVPLGLSRSESSRPEVIQLHTAYQELFRVVDYLGISRSKVLDPDDGK